MLDGLLELAREQGYRAVSLSVDRQNPARRLYESAGFRDAGISPETDTSVTMVADALITLDTDTGTTVIRVREPAGGGQVTGYIYDDGGVATRARASYCVNSTATFARALISPVPCSDARR